jgi:hypothetical protein
MEGGPTTAMSEPSWRRTNAADVVAESQPFGRMGVAGPLLSSSEILCNAFLLVPRN